MDVEGTYHNLGMFFDRVGRLSRLVNVGNLQDQDPGHAQALEHDPGLVRRHHLRLRRGPPAGAPGQRRRAQ